MNRVHLSILSQKSHTNINRRDSIQQLNKICHPQPVSKGWISEKFPIYPIQFDFYLSNPPFNKIQIVFYSNYKPDIMQFFGSADGKEFFKIEEINSQKDDFQTLNNHCDNNSIELVSKFFKQTHYYQYLRCRIYQNKSTKNQHNLCKQVGIKAIELSNITIFNTKYLCSLKQRLTLHPAIFNYLELLEYKTHLIDKQTINRTRNQIKEKYLKRINEIQSILYKRKIDWIKSNREFEEIIKKQFQQVLNQPLDEEQLDLSNPVELKQTIKKLQHQLSEFYIDRLNNIHKNVEDYFQKYWNIEIRDIYLRLLSSPEDQDQTKALTQYWSEIKQLQEIKIPIEQAALMFLNYYLEFISDPIKIGAIKILCLFLRFKSVGFKLYHVYQRVLFNLLSGYLKQENTEQMSKILLKSIYTIYEKIPNSVFLQQFLDSNTHPSLLNKMKKLQILEKIILNDHKFQIQNYEIKDKIIQFLLDILLVQDIKLQVKNKVYNIAAFMANRYGKQNIMSQFEKLNAMILMNMQKIIDKKLDILKNSPEYSNKLSEFQRSMCQYCGMNSNAFKDQNIYDVHCFKQCPVLMSCQYCSNVIEISQLFKHYLEECTMKNKFKNCDNCNDVIFIDKQGQHNKKCLKNFITKCPLCEVKLENKLKIKEHLLKDGCPNNSRSNKN